jgi:hypothetical protein
MYVENIWIRIGSVFKCVSGFGSGSRPAKIVPKNREKLRNFIIGVFSVGLEACNGA